MEKKYKYSSQIKDDLIYLMDEYCEMKIKEDSKREILHKEKRVEIDKLTKEVYKYLNYDVMLKLAKTKLPLRVKLFNKIEVTGFGQKENSSIYVDCIFNEKYNQSFSIIFSASDINKKLKLNLKVD